MGAARRRPPCLGIYIARVLRAFLALRGAFFALRAVVFFAALRTVLRFAGAFFVAFLAAFFFIAIVVSPVYFCCTRLGGELFDSPQMVFAEFGFRKVAVKTSA